MCSGHTIKAMAGNTPNCDTTCDWTTEVPNDSLTACGMCFCICLGLKNKFLHFQYGQFAGKFNQIISWGWRPLLYSYNTLKRLDYCASQEACICCPCSFRQINQTEGNPLMVLMDGCGSRCPRRRFRFSVDMYYGTIYYHCL